MILLVVSIVLTVLSYFVLQNLQRIDGEIFKKALLISAVSIVVGFLLGEVLLSLQSSSVSSTAGAAVPSTISAAEESTGIKIPFWLKAWLTNSFTVFWAVLGGFIFSRIYLNISSEHGSTWNWIRVDWRISSFFKDISKKDPKMKDLFTLFVFPPLLILIIPFVRTGLFIFNEGSLVLSVIPVFLFEGFLAIYACSMGIDFGCRDKKKIKGAYLAKFLLIILLFLTSAFLEDSLRILLYSF